MTKVQANNKATKNLLGQSLNLIVKSQRLSDIIIAIPTMSFAAPVKVNQAIKKPSIGKVRSTLYKTGKVLGDVNAVKRGTIGRRLANRVTGNIASRMINKLLRTIIKK